ncbi:MAG: hypothetical protein OHK0039_17890 [Bacteroidia bacterium]
MHDGPAFYYIHPFFFISMRYSVCCLLIFFCLPMFLAAQQPHAYSVARDVVWASPDGHDLTMDIYTPETGQDTHPVLVIFHGGGWLINTKAIMNEMAQYMASHGGYVVCNVNYRLLVDAGNTIAMDQIVEDALGAVLWVKEHIHTYRGDRRRVALTGDSAGGHLASMVVVAGDRLRSGGGDAGPGGFHPTYLPAGMTPEAVVAAGGLEVQAAVISYGAFDLYVSCLGDFETASNFFWQMGGGEARSIFGGEIRATTHAAHYQAVSPLYLIPSAQTRVLPPQLFTVGSKDDLTTPASVQDYMNKVREAGHPVRYWEYEGRPHAFLDSGSNAFLGTSFEKDAPAALDVMIAFLDEVLR